MKRKTKCRIANILFHNKCSPRGSLEELTLGWFPVMLSDRFLFDLSIFLCIEFLNYHIFYVSSVVCIQSLRNKNLPFPHIVDGDVSMNIKH